MTLRDVQEILEAEILCGEDCLDREVRCAGGSDLMSDVLAFGQAGLLMMTGLSNSQSVRTADIIDAVALVYVRGKKPDPEGLRLAREKGIPILTTRCMMYTACGRLFEHGLPGVGSI